MKRVLSVFLALLLLLPTLALAEIDLSGLSYDELVTLKDKINLAMWKSEEWQQVTVPQGVYRVGEDIPAGHWTIAAADGQYASVAWGTKLAESGQDVEMDWENGIYEYESLTSPTYEFFTEGGRTSVDFDLKDGQYVVVTYGDVLFTPYQGKPSLGFK